MADDRSRAVELALAQIEKQFGKGSIMRLGSKEAIVPISVISTGAISFDAALGVGGVPRGRVIEIFGPESSGKTTITLQIIAEAQKAGGMAAFVDAEHALDPTYAKKLGVDVDNLLISQPDYGEQALVADLHQPDSRKDRCHVRQSGNHHRWPCVEVLFFCAYRHSSYCSCEGRRHGSRLAHQGEDRQE